MYLDATSVTNRPWQVIHAGTSRSPDDRSLGTESFHSVGSSERSSESGPSGHSSNANSAQQPLALDADNEDRGSRRSRSRSSSHAERPRLARAGSREAPVPNKFIRIVEELPTHDEYGYFCGAVGSEVFRFEDRELSTWFKREHSRTMLREWTKGLDRDQLDAKIIDTPRTYDWMMSTMRRHPWLAKTYTDEKRRILGSSRLYNERQLLSREKDETWGRSDYTFLIALATARADYWRSMKFPSLKVRKRDKMESFLRQEIRVIQEHVGDLMWRQKHKWEPPVTEQEDWILKQDIAFWRSEYKRCQKSLATLSMVVLQICSSMS